jgi:hypothetical protein
VIELVEMNEDITFDYKVGDGINSIFSNQKL